MMLALLPASKVLRSQILEWIIWQNIICLHIFCFPFDEDIFRRYGKISFFLPILNHTN